MKIFQSYWHCIFGGVKACNSRARTPLERIIMRLNLAVLVTMITCIQVNASIVHAQNVTVNVKDAPLRTVFETLRKQTGYQFFFDNDVIKKANKVTMKLKVVPLKEALEQLFNQQPLTYEIVEKTIVVTEKTVQPSSHSKQQVVTGKVTNQSEQPLSGVTVSVKGTNRMTATDNQGNFTIEVGSGQVLVFTYIGYSVQEQVVGNRKTIDVILGESISQLDLVKIQGYGTTTQRLATGNIATINAETIAQQPVTNPLQAISGRIAGVQITQSNGLPGSSISIQIRGRNSIAASNNPLFIIDNVPFVADNITGGGQITNISPLNIFSPNDIESISILKDADATAIYGSRAANGVVLITTKSGKAGKSKLDVNVSRGYSSAARMPQLMSTAEYLQMRRDAFANAGVTPTVTNAPDLLKWDQNVDNDILKWYQGNTADLWDAAATFSGGDQQTQFLLSGNFHNENTIFSNDDIYRRGNVHFSLNHASQNEKLKIKFSGIYATDKNKIQNAGASTTINVAIVVPNYPIYDASGNYNWESNLTNYYAQANAYLKSATENYNLNLNASYQITKYLQFVANLGYSRLINNNKPVSPASSKNPASTNALGSTFFQTSASSTYIVEPQLNYKLELFSGKLSVLVGSTLQSRVGESSFTAINNYLNDLYIESLNAGTVLSISSTESKYKFLSVFSRLNYNWKDRYILNASVRRDGSSRFGPHRHFGNFTSIGGAWLFGNESFIKDKTKWFSYGKLRGSYGSTGSDGIGDYGYLSLYTSTGDYGTQKAIVPGQIANDNFRWESTNKLEIGLELGFFSDRLLLNTSWYRNRSGNQLVSYPLAGTTGFSSYIANLPAVVENKGWEFELNTQNIKGREVTWNSAFNLTVAKNQLFSFPNIEQTSYANTQVIGKPLNLFLGYQLAGIDPNTGIPSFVDINSNGAITTNSSYNGRGGDRIYVGTTDPQWFAGINNSIVWKGLQLDVFFHYTKQKGYNLFAQQNRFNSFGTLQNGFAAYLDYWKSPGDLSQIPKPFATTNTALGQYSSSDQTFSDASYLRLKTLALNYKLPSSWLRSIGMVNTQIFAIGQNLWTVTDFDGGDPELAGSNFIRQSTLKTISIGLKSNF